MITMTKNETTYFKERLDNIYEIVYTTNSKIEGMNEHLTGINKTMELNSKRIEKNYELINKLKYDLTTKMNQQKIDIEQKIYDLDQKMIEDSRNQEQEIWKIKLKLITMITLISSIISTIINYFLPK